MPSSLTSNSKALRAAREYAQLIGEVVNISVSHAPITFRELDHPGHVVGYVTHRTQGKPTAVPLNNGHYLFLYLLLGVRSEDRRLVVLKYMYRYQETKYKDSWIFRYEYEGESKEPYRYSRHHLHVNATPLNYRAIKSFGNLHLPTSSITLESIIRHLIVEHNIEPTSPNWEETLDTSEAHSWPLVQK